MCRCMKSNAKTSGQFSGVYLIFSPHIQYVTEQTSTQKKAMFLFWVTTHSANLFLHGCQLKKFDILGLTMFLI